MQNAQEAVVSMDGRGTQARKDGKKQKKPRSFPWNIGCKIWCIKYFWEGQSISEKQADAIRNLPDDAPFSKKLMIKYRRQIAILIPLTLYHFCWWCVMGKYRLFYLFKTKYFMSIVMILGGLVAGMTTEGGGAVAFPTMTLVFSISPTIARDYSLLIQASGMSAASFVILFMKVDIEWYALCFCTLGALVGSIPGFYFLDPYLDGHWKKMIFSSFWFAFALSLLLLNCTKKRKTYKKIQNMNWWKGVVLFMAGIVGGIFTSIVGTGVDICTFSIMTLLFRISEKIATPTAVMLMAFNSIMNVFWRHVMMEGIATETWEFLAVSFQIVTLLAPVGAIIGSHLHRQVLAAFVYILDFSALVGAFAIIPMDFTIASISVTIIVVGLGVFYGLTRAGRYMMEKVEMKKSVNIGVLPPGEKDGVSNAAYPHDVSMGGTSVYNSHETIEFSRM